METNLENKVHISHSKKINPKSEKNILKCCKNANFKGNAKII
jgi:hypothetical protein